ncbi:MAG: hypothetical protein IPK19_07505 [Chloroflexi bacterium]|nr:hypothetical protein [Chloroflexota bacterium]
MMSGDSPALAAAMKVEQRRPRLNGQVDIHIRVFGAVLVHQLLHDGAIGAGPTAPELQRDFVLGRNAAEGGGDQDQNKEKRQFTHG